MFVSIPKRNQDGGSIHPKKLIPFDFTKYLFRKLWWQDWSRTKSYIVFVMAYLFQVIKMLFRLGPIMATAADGSLLT